MEIALYALGALALLAGVAGTILPALPGAPLIAGGALLVAWAGDFRLVGWPSLVAIGVVSALIVAVDWIAAVLGAKRFGASGWAIAGATVGLVVGMFLGIPGVLLGPIVGAIAFEYLKNANFEAAANAGLGTAIGMLVGGAVKIALSIAAVGILLFALAV